jgi:hypothetical protein
MAFRFGNDTVKIEIEDCIFYVSISQELHEIMLSNNVKMTELKEKITDKSDKEKESDIIPEFDNIIDNVLGKGASEKIFAGRTPDSYERMAVYVYVCDMIKNHCDGIPPRKPDETKSV